MKHILLVDDVSTNLKCLDLLLRNKYKVTMAKSGGEALEFLSTETPDLVLLDIFMKDMDGYEVMRRMKENSKMADIPVIFLTADTEQKSRELGLSLGAADFIMKLVKPQILLDRIEAIWEAEE